MYFVIRFFLSVGGNMEYKVSVQKAAIGTKYQEWTKKNVWKIAFKIEGVWAHQLLQIFKGCLPQILFSLFLNTLFHLFLQ